MKGEETILDADESLSSERYYCGWEGPGEPSSHSLEHVHAQADGQDHVRAWGRK